MNKAWDAMGDLLITIKNYINNVVTFTFLSSDERDSVWEQRICWHINGSWSTLCRNEVELAHIIGRRVQIDMHEEEQISTRNYLRFRVDINALPFSSWIQSSSKSLYT